MIERTDYSKEEIIYFHVIWTREGKLALNTGYRLLEMFSQGKSFDEEKNEDGIFIGQRYIAVIDGTTSKNAHLYKGKTGGQLARDTIIKRLSKIDTVNDSGALEAEHVIREIQKSLYEYQQHLVQNTCQSRNTDLSQQTNLTQENPVIKQNLPIHLSASAVIYSCDKREIWSVGDCQFSVNSEVERNSKRVDEIFAETRSAAIHALLESGYTEEELFEDDIVRELLLPFLKLQQNLENKAVSYGYCAFNGNTSPGDFPFRMVRCMKVPDGAEIVLASDGYPRLGRTLEESEKYLSEVLESDPLCYKRHCSTKGLMKGNRSFDDRTYVRFMC